VLEDPVEAKPKHNSSIKNRQADGRRRIRKCVWW